MFTRMLARLAGRGRTGPWSHLGTQADAALQGDLLPTLFVADMLVEGKSEADRCPDRSPMRVEILAPLTAAPDGHLQPWGERWTIARCGVEADYRVDFTPTSDGGTDYRIRLGDGSDIRRG